MADESLQVDGLSELYATLDTFAGNVQNKLTRGALRAAQMVIANAAKAGIPVAPPSKEDAANWGSYAGALRDSVKVTTRLSASTGQAVATLAVGNSKAFYARWVEFGTKAHIIRAKGGKALSFGGHPVPWVQHPGARANPFLRIAIDANVQAATEVFAEYLRDRITSELDKMAGEVDA